MLTPSTTEQLKRAIRGAHRVLRAMPIQWQHFSAKQWNVTLLTTVVQAGQYNQLCHTIWELPPMWVIREQLSSLLISFAKLGQLSDHTFQWWDGITTAPETCPNNPLLSTVPIHNKVDSIGTSMQHNLTAKQLEASNADTLKTMYGLTLKTGLGTINIDGKQYINPKVHEATLNYINVSPSVIAFTHAKTINSFLLASPSSMSNT